MANFYDMTPEELDLYIKEGGYDKSKSEFLRNEWAKKNTLSGKAKASLEDATQLPEGFDRADFLPVSKPEGKSVIDALKSGEANWAMPGALVDTADQILTAGRTGEKMTAGLPVSEDEQMQAAFTGAGVAAGGSSAFTVPEGAVRHFGGKVWDEKTSNSKRPSAYYQPERGFVDNAWINPITTALENLDVPKNGIRGSELKKVLQSDPEIRGSFLTSTGILDGIQGDKRYFKADLNSLSEQFDSATNVIHYRQFENYQRQSQQGLVDKEIDYKELGVSFDFLSDNAPNFKANEQHFNENTLSHARVSKRKSSNTGEEYLLVEELQSDLLQKGYEKPRKATESETAVSAPPIKKTKESVDTSLKAIIAEAQESGVNKIVIPPFEKILAARFDPASNTYKKMLQKGSPFHNTYVKALNESLDELQKNYPEVRISTKNLPYSDANNIITSLINKGYHTDIPELNLDYYDFTPAELLAENIQLIINRRSFNSRGFTFKNDKAYRELESELGLKDYFDGMNEVELNSLNPDAIADQFLKSKQKNLLGLEIDISELSDKYDLTRPRFNKGGLVTMDEQMSMFDVKGFAEGGMATDPVSGNEIPPGASAEEVRDDIDAKLSEGEYVVPADVVQYYGVKFFEKLREKAKSDLEEMASDGRIGGEPIEEEDEETEDDEELSPEEMAMLQEVMSQDSGNVEMQMAEGGLVPKADKNMQPTFDPKKWQSMGASLTNSGASQSGSLYKTFVGPSGEVRMILFVNGKPITPIPKGFTEKTAQPTQAKVEEPAYNNQADEGRDKREDREQPADSKSWAERNYEALSTDPVKFGMEQLKGGLEDKLGPLGATMIGGPVFGSIAAAGAQVENIASAKAAERIAQSKGLDTTELSSSIKSAEENLSGFGKLATQTFNAASGDNYYKSWEETNSERSRDKGVTNSASRTPSTAGPRDETGSNGGGVYSPDSRPEGPSSRPEGGTGGAGVGGGPSTGPSKSDMQKDIGEQGGYQGGYGFNKGGLVTKKVKPTKNKGLVTKRK